MAYNDWYKNKIKTDKGATFNQYQQEQASASKKYNAPKNDLTTAQKANMATYDRVHKSSSDQSQGYVKSNAGRYAERLTAMQNDPELFYSAFNNSKGMYTSELGFYEYMTELSQYDLPDQYTHYAQVYDDMRVNPQKYIDGMGSESAYKYELDRYKELYGLEKSVTSGVISTIKDRASYSFLQENGLDQFYQYDPANPDDAILAELGYAPSSFEKASKLSEKAMSGYSAALVQDPYLQTLYKYDETDPEDMLNKALGLAPKSFAYGTTDDEKYREKTGALPIEAETYVKNSQQFEQEYIDYASKMQEYKDLLAEYEAIPALTRWLFAKPQNPYENEPVPESVQAYLDYKIASGETPLLEGKAGEQDFYNKTGETTVEKPWFYFNEDMPGDISEFEIGDIMGRKMAEKAKIYEDVPFFKMFDIPLVDSTISNAANGAVEEDIIAEMKQTGEYDAMVQEQQAQAKVLSDTVKADYSKENYAVLKQADLAQELDVSGGTSQLNDMAIKALKFSAAPDITTALSQISLVPTADKYNANAFDATFAYDAEIKNIKTQLDAAGWKGETKSDDPEIQTLIEQAEYRVYQLRDKNVQAYREFTKDMPSWIMSIANGLVKGVDSWSDSYESVMLELAKGISLSPELDAEIAKMINKNAQKGQAQSQIDMVNIQSGTGEQDVKDFSSKYLYNAVAAVTEMGINIGIGAGMAAGAAPGTATTGNIWKTLGKKLLINPRTSSFFVSSLGHNLMQGELEGRSDNEKWLAALPSAYVETVIEGFFGAYSASSSPMGILLKTGTNNLKTRTLANFGKSILSYTVGESLEENSQDIVNMAFRDIFYEGYDPGKIQFGTAGAYVDWERMGDTTKTTMLVGAMMMVFGVGGSIRNIKFAVDAERNFNNGIEAYENGDIDTMNKEFNKLGGNLKQALDQMTADYESGQLDKVLDYGTMEVSTAQALREMQESMKVATELRLQQQNGVDIPQAQIYAADARANAAIMAIETGIKGQKKMAATKYDQVSTSPELTDIVSKNGFAAKLIQSAPGKMSEIQIEIAKNADTEAQKNPFINVPFTGNTTVESLQQEQAKAEEVLADEKVYLQAQIAKAEAGVKAAYAISQKSGQASHKRFSGEVKAARTRVASLNENLINAQYKVDAIIAQGQLRTSFDAAAIMQRPTVITPTVTAPVVAEKAVVEPAQATEATEAILSDETMPSDETQAEEATTPENSVQPTGNDIEYAQLTTPEGFKAARRTSEQKLAESRKLNTEYVAAVDSLKASKRVDIKDMSLTKTVQALEAHAIYIENLAAGAKDIKKPSISVKGLKPSEIEAIGKALANKTNAVKNLRSIAKEIQKRADAEIKQAQNKLLKKLRDLKSKKLTDNFRNIVDGMLNSIDITSKKMTDAKRENMEFIKAYAKETYTDKGLDIPFSLKRAYAPLDKTRVGEMTIEELEEISQNLNTFIMDDKVTRGENKTVRGNTIKQTEEQLAKTKPDKLKFPVLSFESQPRHWGGSFGENFNKAVIDPIMEGSVQEGANNMYIETEVLKPLDDIIKKEFGIKKHGAKNAAKTVEPTLGETLAKHEILEVYMDAQDINGFDNLVTSGTDPIKLQQFVKSFKENYPEYYKAAGLIRKAIDYYQPLINAVHKHVTGNVLVTERMANENPYYYMQHKTDYFESTPENSQDTMSIKPSFTISRTNGGKVDLVNPLWAIHQFHQQANRYTSYAAALHDANIITQTDTVKSMISEMGKDKDGAEKIKKYIREYMFTVAKADVAKNPVDKVLREVRGNVAASILTFTPTIAPKQFTAIYLAMRHIKPQYIFNPVYFLKAVKTLTNKKARFAWYEKSPDMYTRVEEGYIMVEAGQLKGKLKGQARAIRYVDALTCAMEYHMAEAQVKSTNPNASQETIDRKTSELFHNVMWDTQQMYGAAFSNPISRSEPGRWLMMFSSQQYQIRSLMIQGARDIKNGRTTKGMATIAGVVINNLVYAAMRLGILALMTADYTDDDVKEDFTGEFVKTTLNTLFPVTTRLAGNALNAIPEIAGSDFKIADDYKMTVPVVEAITNVANSLLSVASDKKTVYGKIINVAKPIASLLGIPLANAEKWISKLAESVLPDFKYDDWKTVEDAQAGDPTPSSYYDDLKKAAESGSTSKAKKYIEKIIETDGDISRWLNADSGGAELTAEQRMYVINLWPDA